jgi:mannose-6-phosphate isomerase-like protein (cupin superfamily)
VTQTRLFAAGVLALAVQTAASAPAEPKKQVTALEPQDIRWFTPPFYTDGRQRASLRGDSSKGGDWIDRVKIPGGSRVQAHTHPRDEVVTVLEGTWYLGIGKSFDETKLKAYPAGSFIVIPADVPHFLATREGPVIVQVSGHGMFRTSYAKD